MGRFATLKKIGSKIWDAKTGFEKIGSGLFFCYSEREEAARQASSL
jgi:hypothetical protein